jgi:hypothetical protein
MVGLKSKVTFQRDAQNCTKIRFPFSSFSFRKKLFQKSMFWLTSDSSKTLFGVHCPLLALPHKLFQKPMLFFQSMCNAAVLSTATFSKPHSKESKQQL